MLLGLGISLPALSLAAGIRGVVGPNIQLSQASVAENAADGSTIGTLSVVNGTGTWTFTKAADPDAKFGLTGIDLTKAAAVDYETKTAHSVTIEATNGTDTITRTFNIGVVNVLEVTLAALSMSPTSFAQDAAAGTVIGTVSGLAAGADWTVFPNDGRVAKSGNNLVVGLTQSTGDFSITLRHTHPDAVNSPLDTVVPLTVTAPAGEMIGGVALGAAGSGFRSGYVLQDGDDFDTTTAADFLTPTNSAGAYMTTRHYGIQSGAPRYLRGAASLGGYEADPWHTGFADAGRGAVPASFADTIEFSGGSLRTKARRATTGEKAIMGPLADKNNVSAMVHMGRRNMMRAPFIMEMRLRFPYALSAWDQNHPTFWIIQSQPGNGWDGLELDCEGFGPALQFNRNTWNNGVGQYGPTLGTTQAVSKTEYRAYAFEIVQVSGVWKVRLWENGALVAEGSPDYGGNVFDPSRPFHLMMTSHILQSGINQSIWDAAGDAGAQIECDWWRCWTPATGVFREPLVPAATLLTDFNTPFSFTLPTPADVWGAGVSSDVIEMIPNEDNSPAQPWVRGLLPPSVTRTGNTLAGTIADQAGRLVLARSCTPANGDGCKPQPITICVGPRITLSNLAFTPGQAVSVDLYAACDCGDLHIGKTVSVNGLAGSGLTYNASTGLLTGTAAAGTYTLAVTVQNAVGQTAAKEVGVTVAATGSSGYLSWDTLVGDFDSSDDQQFTVNTGSVTTWKNGKAGSGDLGVPSGVTQPTARVATVQNNRDITRYTRGGAAATNSVLTSSSASGIAQALTGTNVDFTLIALFKPTVAATGFLCGWAQSVDATSARQCGIVRRSGSNSSLRYGPDNAPLDVSLGILQDNTAHIVAWKHEAGKTTAWVNSATTKVANAVAHAPSVAFAPEFAIGNLRTTSVASPPYATTGFGGDVYEVVAASSARTDAEIQQAITDLAAKWGITLS